jgi:hypothetical protein
MSKSPSLAADYIERQAEEALRREHEMNAFVERKNPHLKPTARYIAGPLPSNHPQFHTRAHYLDYLRRRELGKYNPKYINY